MVLMSAAITLFAILSVDEAQATRNDEQLAKMFSPILILTEETNNRYDETVPIRVIKPEPVEIVGAHNIAYMWFDIPGIGQGHYLDSEYFNTNDLSLNEDLLSKQFYGTTSPNRFDFDRGNLVYEWNGEDAEGRRVPPGIYLCRIQIDAQAKVQDWAQIIHVAY